MTGYESKKAMSQDKLNRQWDTPSEAFNNWWNGEYDDNTNPFTKYSLAYWAFAGWQAALAQRTWVDLPHEDILDLFDEHNVYGSKWLEFARAVLAKSKEKNNG